MGNQHAVRGAFIAFPSGEGGRAQRGRMRSSPCSTQNLPLSPIFICGWAVQGYRVSFGCASCFVNPVDSRKARGRLRLRARGLRRPGANAAPAPRKGHRPLTLFRWRDPVGCASCFVNPVDSRKARGCLRLRARGLRRPGANAAPAPRKGHRPLTLFRWRDPVGCASCFVNPVDSRKARGCLRLRARGLRRPGANAAPAPRKGHRPLTLFRFAIPWRGQKLRDISYLL